MAEPQNIDVLNRLLELEYRSLPMYLAGTSYWTHIGDERATAVFEQIVADQKVMAGRLADLIFDRGGLIDSGTFSMQFTDMHMLSLDYLIRELVNWQRYTIAEIEKCIAGLSKDPEARHLAQETLGSERGHLDNLLETIKELV